MDDPWSTVWHTDEARWPTQSDPTDHDWVVPWRTSPTTSSPEETQFESRVVPSELLDSLIQHCQQVAEEIWPPSESSNEEPALEHTTDIASLLSLLVPADSTLPPPVQFSETATAKAMNDALKLTRHLPASAGSPLSRLLSSKGSLEWEKSIKAMRHIVPDLAHVGWRVLEKEGRPSTVDESKPRKPTGGLLSFWNRKASAMQTAPVEAPSERSARSSLESTKSIPHPSSSRAASPSKASVQPPLSPDNSPTVIAAAPAPSAVSRFLNRFSRTKSAQHGVLALSSDDLEFLSDIVPSASDPPDEDINNNVLGVLTSARDSSLLPPKLPPPISPPPKPVVPLTQQALGIPGSTGVVAITPASFQVQGPSHAPNVPVLAPPLSAKPTTTFSCDTPSLKDAVTSTFSQSTTSVQQRHRTSTQINSRPSTLPPPLKVPPLLCIPPLLPPPPVSPPQTPRPSTFSSRAIPSHSFTTQSIDIPSFHDFHDSDDEFSAFASFPSAPTPFPSSDSQRPPSPPSPPPRRTYERAHYPSTSSTSSIFSPVSQTSTDQLYPTRSSISASLDSFDDFVSPMPMRGESREHASSPPPLPVKSQSQHKKSSGTYTPSTNVHHTHTSSQAGLLNGMFPSVSDAEHQRTQSLVNHAAARGGFLWPNSPELNEPKVTAIPPPPSSSSTSPQSLNGKENFNLLDDIDTLHGGLEAWHSPLNVVEGIGMASSPAAGSLGLMAKGLELQSSPPSLPSTSTPLFSFSSLGAPVPSTTTNAASSQPMKSKQTGGLSAQDLSFFEGW